MIIFVVLRLPSASLIILQFGLLSLTLYRRCLSSSYSSEEGGVEGGVEERGVEERVDGGVDEGGVDEGGVEDGGVEERREREREEEELISFPDYHVCV